VWGGVMAGSSRKQKNKNMKKQAMKIVTALIILAGTVDVRAAIVWSFYTTTGGTDTSWVATPLTPVNLTAVNFGATTLADASYRVPGGETWAWKAPTSGGLSGYTHTAGSTTVTYSGVIPNSTRDVATYYSGGDSLLHNGAYTDWNSPGTVTVSGLAVNQQYTIQLVIADTRPIGDQFTDFGDGSGTHRYAYTDGRYLVATGTGTADATSLAITLKIPTQSDSSLINALRVRTPATPVIAPNQGGSMP